MSKVRKPKEEGPRLYRLPEARYYEAEADLVRSVAGNSISDFIRKAVLNEAKRVSGLKHPTKAAKKR